MGAPKQKWTAEEEAALRAGVEKYGPGKWRAIQKDSKFGPCLTSRSNVDLKDKWRNMSVSANGLGSARKPLAITGGPGMLTLMEDASSVLPLAVLPPTDDAQALKRESADTSGDRKSLGPRYDDMVFEAVMGLKEPYGSSNASIASYIEERHAVPSNFRRLLTTKLKELALSGKLVKVRQNYKMNEGNDTPVPVVEEHEYMESENAIIVSDARPQKESRLRRQDAQIEESSKPYPSQLPRDSFKKSKPGVLPYKKPKIDFEHLVRARTKTAEEAARAAAVAVAEAEAAAAAAEAAAREAEAAEAEAEALEAAAEVAAAAAIRPLKKLRAMAVMQEVAVNG